ncbi:MAG: antibiotic biosynthesis monooxygenase [Myxococcota bacterium]
MSTHRIITAVLFLVVTACAMQEGKPVLDNPFDGPGWDREHNRPKDPSRTTFVAAATHLVVKDDPEAHRHFLEVFSPIREKLESGDLPGFVGYGTRTAGDLHEDWTISLWESEEAMYNFVTSDEHMRAIETMGPWSEDGVVIHWEIRAQDLPLTYEMALEKLRNTGRDVY